MATNLVQELGWLPGDQLDDERWIRRLDTFMSINPGIEAYLLDLQGNIQAAGALNTQVQRQRIDVKPLQQHIVGNHMYPLIGQDPVAINVDKPFTVAPVPDRESVQGYLYVVLQSQQQLDFEANKKANYYWLISMYILAVSLTIGFIVAVLFFSKFIQRINNLTSAVSHFRDSDFSQKPYQQQLENDYNDDEIGYLNQSFDSMAQHIQTQVAQIQAVDENRRNVLAGISHDLRTPLTALRGHLEILSSKSDQFEDKENQKYLDISIRNAVRMGEMIEDIFQLSRLQAKEIELLEEAFSIEDLAQDVLLMLKPIALQKGTKLVLDLSSESIPTVCADISLIERVLVNLTTNAINHTDQGEIKLSITEQNRVVKICVIDNGSGIDFEDQQKIFLPYYQASTTSTNANKSGLGLAICGKDSGPSSAKTEFD